VKGGERGGVGSFRERGRERERKRERETEKGRKKERERERERETDRVKEKHVRLPVLRFVDVSNRLLFWKKISATIEIFLLVVGSSLKWPVIGGVCKVYRLRNFAI